MDLPIGIEIALWAATVPVLVLTYRLSQPIRKDPNDKWQFAGLGLIALMLVGGAIVRLEPEYALGAIALVFASVLVVRIRMAIGRGAKSWIAGELERKPELHQDLVRRGLLNDIDGPFARRHSPEPSAPLAEAHDPPSST